MYERDLQDVTGFSISLALGKRFLRVWMMAKEGSGRRE
jgi:hypothetical protein